jgi:hypothetical protein
MLSDQQVASGVRSFIFRGLRGLKAWMASADDLRHEKLTEALVSQFAEQIARELGVTEKPHPWRAGNAVKRGPGRPRKSDQTAAEITEAPNI